MELSKFYLMISENFSDQRVKEMVECLYVGLIW